MIAAQKAAPEEAARAFSTTLAAELARLPYESVQAELTRIRVGLGPQSAAFLEGMVANKIDQAARTGQISKDLAMLLVDFKFALQRVPYNDETVRQLSALDAAHAAERSDIWGARDVSLEGRAGLTPVVIAIWDTGVDTAVFPGRVWTNAKEVPGNGKDDDGNGYVDDVHGIAWTWDGTPQAGDLFPIDLSPAELATARQARGSGELKRLFADAPKDDAKRLDDNVSLYSYHAHGTHVAGIAVSGNPAARVLVVRLDQGWHRGRTPPPATAAWAKAFVSALARSVEYYRNAGVRVVNMSWYVGPSELERSLDLNGVGATQQARHQLAIQSFNTVKRGFRAAIDSAPEILFVCGAGNSNNSNQFNDFAPASFDLPNTLTVGAVDYAGDESGFTSFGKIDLYANGVGVESVMPGGDTQRCSGTSMASPQVANLAAKLLAVHPQLTTAALRKLIMDGADTKQIAGERSIRLLNEARSFELAGRPR